MEHIKLSKSRQNKRKGLKSKNLQCMRKKIVYEAIPKDKFFADRFFRDKSGSESADKSENHAKNQTEPQGNLTIWQKKAKKFQIESYVNSGRQPG